ncbi:MAG: 6-bladed beta-propeller [Bacteroidota bacterium]
MHKRYFWIQLVGWMGIVILTACQSSPQTIPLTESNVLNKMVKAAPQSIIDLDAIPVDTLVATRENQLGHKTASHLEEKVLLSKPNSIEKIGKKLYVSDFDQNSIFVMNDQGTWIDWLGRKGHGPGEFFGMGGIFSNAKHIYVIDPNNTEIDVFDHNFKFENSFNYLTMGGFYPNATASNHWILTPAPMNSNVLINQNSVVEPFDSLGTVFEPIVPRDFHPMAQNRFDIDATLDGDYVLAFRGVPYLFMFDKDHQQTHSIYLQADYFDTIDNPTLEPRKNADPMSMGIKMLVNRVYLESDGSLWLQIKNQLYKLVPEGDQYTLKRSIIMPYGKELRKNQTDKFVTLGDMSIDGNTLYVCSIREKYIYKFEL